MIFRILLKKQFIKIKEEIAFEIQENISKIQTLQKISENLFLLIQNANGFRFDSYVNML